jgi:hypothetical protein
LLAFASGASFGVLTLLVFKLMHSPTNDTLQLTSDRALWSRLTDRDTNLQILSSIRETLNFGRWSVNPLAIMAIHTAIAWSPVRSSTKLREWFTPAFVIAGMLCGYYVVYVLSPYDVESHVISSLNRLLLQLWPAIVIVYSTMVAPRHALQPAAEWPRRIGMRVTAVAVVAAVIAVAIWPAGGKPMPVPAGTKPHIELNRTEVTVGETYVMKITGVRGPQVYVSYSLDGKPMGQFGAYLGADGAVDFQVSASTPKGTYRFLTVRAADDTLWTSFENDAAITVK